MNTLALGRKGNRGCAVLPFASPVGWHDGEQDTEPRNPEFRSPEPGVKSAMSKMLLLSPAAQTSFRQKDSG